MGGCNGNCINDGYCETCNIEFCSFGYKCDKGKPDAYWLNDKKYCIKCRQIERQKKNKLQAKLNKIINDLKTKYKEKINIELLTEILSKIKIALLGTESESSKDSIW